MIKLKNQIFEGERALFKSNKVLIDGCTFQNGESPLKESKNYKVINSTFSWKYPLWYSKNVYVNNTKFEEMARSGIWYTNNITLENCDIIAPKQFRRSKKITILNSKFHNAQETLWNCNGIKMKNVYAKGDYLMLNSKNIEIDNLYLDGNYVFDGATNIKISNSTLNSKDSFWNVKNAYVKNCKIVGEYIGWNSENIVFENCEIESLQGFCYMKNVKLINCKLINTTLSFEFSTVEAKILSSIDSVKNPISGSIEALKIDELIMDENIIDPSKTKIITKE